MVEVARGVGKPSADQHIAYQVQFPGCLLLMLSCNACHQHKLMASLDSLNHPEHRLVASHEP
jgi:hypothetical protein